MHIMLVEQILDKQSVPLVGNVMLQCCYELKSPFNELYVIMAIGLGL